MAYACVRTDNMSGTHQGKDLVTLRYTEDVENGNVLAIGALEAGEREVRSASAPAAKAELREVALVATPEVVKDKDNYALSDFINKKGELIRGYRFASKDVFSITKEAFAEGATLEVGANVCLNGSTKLTASEEASEDATKVGTIIAIEGAWYVIEVA